MTGSAVYEFLDFWLIWAFRTSDNPYVGFAIGLLWICLITTVIGELCIAGVYFMNKKHFAELNRNMVSHHNLSIRALGAKDKVSWKACNSIANEAFGKNFFSHIALFASSLWIVPFVIGWMSYRFGEVDFIVPLLGAVGPAFVFIPAYILFRYLFGKAKPWIPVFKVIQRKIKENEGDEDMMSYSDLARKEETTQENVPVPESS